MEKTSLAEYIAMHNMEGANNLLLSHGVPPQTSVVDCAYCLKTLSSKKGDPFILQLAGIHPDKQIIQETITGRTGNDGTYSNCSGGCGCGKSNFSNASGSSSAPVAPAPAPSNMLGLVMVFAIAAVVITIIHKN